MRFLQSELEIIQQTNKVEEISLVEVLPCVLRPLLRLSDVSVIHGVKPAVSCIDA